MGEGTYVLSLEGDFEGQVHDVGGGEGREAFELLHDLLEVAGEKLLWVGGWVGGLGRGG